MLGGTMIFDQPDLSDLTVSFWSVLVPAVTAMALFGGLIVFSVGKVLMFDQIVGVDELESKRLLVDGRCSKYQPGDDQAYLDPDSDACAALRGFLEVSHASPIEENRNLKTRRPPGFSAPRVIE